jgi:hypothetical protein
MTCKNEDHQFLCKKVGMSHPRTNEEMKEDMATANDIVDIAGVWYFMGEKKKIKGLFKNKQQFQTDFDNSIRTEWLFRTYLPYSIESAGHYAFASDNEKEELITLLTKRKDAIFSSPRFKRMDINWSNLLRTFVILCYPNQ